MSRCWWSAASPARSAIRPAGPPPGRRRAPSRCVAQRAAATSTRSCGSWTRTAPRSSTTPTGSAPMASRELLGYTRQITVAQLLERDDFARRFAAHAPISLSEFLYPLLQGIDSVEIARRHRARRHRPDLQQPGGPRAAAGRGPAAAGRAHRAAARRHRRRGEDGQVARQLHRDHRAARRAVRQADVHPGLRASAMYAQLGTALHPREVAAARRRRRPPAACRRTGPSGGWPGRS